MYITYSAMITKQELMDAQRKAAIVDLSQHQWEVKFKCSVGVCVIVLPQTTNPPRPPHPRPPAANNI